MRTRASHFACLLLLLSSLAVTNARAGGVEASRTPGGVFVRNLLMQVAVEEFEPVVSRSDETLPQGPAEASQTARRTVLPARAPAVQTAHVHAVTGCSL